MLGGALPILVSAALPASMAVAGIVQDGYTAVAMFTTVLVLYMLASLWFRFSVKDAKGALAPRWDLFNIANTLSLVLFGTAVTYLLRFLMAAGSHHAVMYFAAQPGVLVACATALVSLVYMVGFFGVALVYEDVSASAAPLVGAAPVSHPSDVGYDADVIVVGAGTAGTALALRMAKDGHRVTVVERSMTIPHRIVGELMQPGGIRALEDMGLDAAAKAEAIDPIQVDGYVCFTPGADRDRDLVLPYPDADPASLADFAGLQGLPERAPVPGPITSGFKARPGTDEAIPRGRSFHNHRFVQALRDMAVAHPNITILEGRATALLAPSDLPAEHPGAKLNAAAAGTAVGIAWTALDKTKGRLTAPLTVVADGAHSALRKHAVAKTPISTTSYFVGLVLNHKEGTCPLPYPRHGHVVLADPNPVLLYQISSLETRILVDVPAPLPNPEDGSLAAYLLDKVLPQLPTAVRPLFKEAVDTQNADVCANKLMPAMPFTRSHAVAVGDSWNMRHPLTGGGMTVALKDVCSLWQHLGGVDLLDSPTLATALAAHASSRAQHAATINVLANALHGVFTNPTAAGGGKDSGDSTRARLREACMQYLALGGANAAGPVGLLSGLTPKPWVLVGHFFAVAMYAMRLALLPCPSPSSLSKAYDLLHVACIIIMPLLAGERSTVLSWTPVQYAVHAAFPWMGVAL